MLALCTPIILCLLILAALILLLFRKWRISIVIIIFAILLNNMTETVAYSFGKGCNHAENTITILIFNMHSQGEYMDLNRDNPEELLELLLTQYADIILLQEYDSIRCHAFRDTLLQNYPFTHYTSGVMTYGQNAIFSKWKLEPQWQHPEHELINVYKVVRDKDSLAIINCHLQSNNIGEKIILHSGKPSWLDNMGMYVSSINESAEQRKFEAIYIRGIADSCLEASLPVIVAGDMNDVGGSMTIRTIEGSDNSELKDSWWERGTGLGFTYHGYEWLHFRLDHIFHSHHFEAVDAKVVKQSFSDHEILLSKLKIK